MAAISTGIIFVNDDISPSIQNTLTTQLFIDFVLTGDEFDTMIAAEPTYPTRVKQNRKRILVIRTYAQNAMVNNIPNRQYADLILFIANGLANMLTNCGHGPTFPVAKITWGDFGLF